MGVGKMPEVHFNNNIKYDVPYRYMENPNDCWEAALLMLYEFVDLQLAAGALPAELRSAGLKAAQAAQILQKFLVPHDHAPVSAIDYYRFLLRNGPALVVLEDLPNVLHAQILTGVYRSTVFLNNPDQDFLKADLSASGPFHQIEKSIMDRYGGISLDEWEETQSTSNMGGTTPAAPALARDRSAEQTPQHSPRISIQSALPAPRASLQSSPPSPRISIRSSLPSPQLSPQNSPPSSPRLSLQRSPSALPMLSLQSSSPPSPRLSGPAQPDPDWAALRMDLQRRLGNTPSAQKRRYIEAMEEQFLFRKNRPMALTVFQSRLLKDEGCHPLWTLPDWQVDAR